MILLIVATLVLLAWLTIRVREQFVAPCGILDVARSGHRARAVREAGIVFCICLPLAAWVGFWWCLVLGWIAPRWLIL